MERFVNAKGFINRNINLTLKRLVAVSALALSAQSFATFESRATELDGDVARIWNKITLQAILDTQPSPTVAARALAIVNTCMFDAWTYFDPRAIPTQLAATAKAAINERTLDNKTAAISAAAYSCLSDQFPSRTAYFKSFMRKLGYEPANAANSQGTAARFGYIAAAQVLAYRHRDGSNQLGDLGAGSYVDYSGYRSANAPDKVQDIDRWQPLLVPTGGGQFQRQGFTTAHWGKVVPFALARGDQFRPTRPPASLPASLLREDREFQEQAREIIQYTAGLTDEQKVIADYWADGPNSSYPPGHWCVLADFVSTRDRMSLDENIKLYFALGNAVFDAGIAAWDAKRAYDSVRPITAIRYLFRGVKIQSWGGPGLDNVEMLGEEWIPYQSMSFLTPGFPDFVSGHSTFSAAAAEILRRFTRSDVFGMRVVVPKGTSRTEPGITPKTDVTLTWATFTDAAEQAGMSRRYGGIHFKAADIEGRELGRKVGAEVWKKVAHHFGEPAAPPSETPLVLLSN
jgi:hypothetical protein